MIKQHTILKALPSNLPFAQSRLAMSLCLAATFLSPPLQAQTLEEVIVTATKREQGLQDIPIAMSVMNSEQLSQSGIVGLDDMSSHMPAVHITEATDGDQVFIRGIGSGVNFGFEQSVGTFIDNVYYGRGRNARFAFLDVERVEVLKGPQSTLFGKNTIAGAINITTATPKENFESYVQANYNTELEGRELTGMITGPLSETVFGRLVAKSYEDNGYVENTYIGEDGPQMDTWAARGSLLWHATPDLSLTLKVEKGEFDVVGRPQMIGKASDTAISLYRTAYPDFDPDFNFERSMANLQGPGRRQGEYDETDSNIYQLTIDYQLDEHTLRSVTAYTDYSFELFKDADYSPLEITAQTRREEHKQLSQEFVLLSPTGQTMEYKFGLFFQDTDLEHHEEVDISLSNLGAAGLPVPPLDGSSNHTFTQEGESWSAFAELTWNVSDQFRTIVGIRQSYDEKVMTNTTFMGEFQNPTEPDAFLCQVYSDALGFIKCFTFDENTPNFDNRRTEQHTSGSIALQYDFDSSMMAYLNLSNGYKGGGYDESNRLASVENEEFDDETVESLEIGLKADLLDRRLRLNLAAFYSEYDNMQVSTFDGNSSFVVGNASESRVQGAEGDLEFAWTDSITVNAAFSYLDAEYTSFPNAACNAEQEATWSENGPCRQDLSGAPLQFAPEWSASFSAEYTRSLTEFWDLQVNATANFMDDYEVANDLDKNLRVGSYWKMDARVALHSSDGHWMLALLGKNLTDEKVLAWGNDVPFGSLGFAETYHMQIDPPRSFEIQARYNF